MYSFDTVFPVYVLLGLTNRHRSAREETEENKKSLEFVIFDSQVSIQ